MNKNEMIQQIREYQSYILSSGILVILVWLVSAFLLPNIHAVQATLEERKTEDQKIATLTKKINALNIFDKVSELDLLQKVNTVLPEEKDAFSIFTGLDKLEKDSSVFITHSDFRIGVVSTGAAQLAAQTSSKFGHQSIDISFAIVGQKENVIAFLRNIINFKTRLFTAKNISISYDDPDHLSASFTLSTYYLPLPKQLGGADKPLLVESAKQQDIEKTIAQNAVVVNETDQNIIHGKSNLFSP